MAPKSSDGQVKDEREEEEGDDESVETEGDSEESYESDDEEVNDEEVTQPEWDKDSFDGREYHSSDDQGEFMTEAAEQSVRSYRRLVIKTKGFFSSSEIAEPLYILSGISTATGLDGIMGDGLTVRQFLANMASLCVEKHNKEKGLNVKLEHILRANFNPGGRTKYYITFAARESDSADAPLVEYQAKVLWSAGMTYPILCRPSPTLKQGFFLSNYSHFHHSYISLAYTPDHKFSDKLLLTNSIYNLVSSQAHLFLNSSSI